MATEGEIARIKGGVLISRLNLLARQPEAKRIEVFQRLSAADRKVLEGVIMPIGWYPLELNLRLDAAIASVLSPRDRSQAFIDMGRASAEENLKGPHHVFIRRGDPHFLLSHAQEIYRLYYAVGLRSYEKTGPHSGTLRTLGAESVTEADCLTIIGWHQRAIEMSGGHNVRIDHTKCRARGNGVCEYTCHWEL